eukprot:4706656-Prymnesium_polylepis.1
MGPKSQVALVCAPHTRWRLAHRPHDGCALRSLRVLRTTRRGRSSGTCGVITARYGHGRCVRASLTACRT